MRTITCNFLSTSLLVFAVALSGACASSTEQDPSSTSSPKQNQMTGQEAAAKKALEALPALVTKDTFSGMGFRSIEEASRATLGTPIRRRTVGYDKLLNYKAGTPLAQLFESREEFIYPVLVGQDVRTSIVVAGNASGWQITSVGDRYLANIISNARQTTPGTPPRTDIELVSMPGINFDLVSFSEGGQAVLQPTRDLPEAKLFTGRSVKADDALIAISNYAKEFDRKYGPEIRKRRLVN